MTLEGQSSDEWLTAYSGGEPPPSLPGPEPSRTFVYSHHRTTKNGRLILSFADENGEEALLWFNVILQGKGKQYRTGEGGQFIPKPRSKFRKWWMQTVGYEPARWSRVHHKLSKELGQLQFVGRTEFRQTAEGEYYRNIIIESVHNNCTDSARTLHGDCTNTARENCTAKSPEPTPQAEYSTIKVPDTQSAQKPNHVRVQVPEYLSPYSSIPLEEILEAYRERAAIMEYDGGLDRHEADQLAADNHLRICSYE